MGLQSPPGGGQWGPAIGRDGVDGGGERGGTGQGSHIFTLQSESLRDTVEEATNL